MNKSKLIEIFKAMADKYRNPAGRKFFDSKDCLLCKHFSCGYCPVFNCRNNLTFRAIANSLFSGDFNVYYVLNISNLETSYRARFHEQAAQEVEKLPEHVFEPGNYEMMLPKLRERLMEIDSDLYEEYLREVKNDRITI